MYFGGDQTVPRPINIKDDLVEMVTSFKYLDIVLDSNLAFNAHVDHVYKKPSRECFYWGS